jgi:dTDP-4-amino-4,6-dideoxygalactose transaminase
VGETVKSQEISRVVEFLVPRGSGDKAKYTKQLGKVSAEIEKLASLGEYAGKLTLGSRVESLEKKAAAFLKAKHVAFMATATAGFEVAYKYAGIGPGDEVIAPAITFIATIAYPLAVGAKVVLADVDPATLNMDPADVAKKITKRTKVIIPVHLGGYPVDMAPIMRLARENDITVIEDAAHAFGATYRGRPAGTIGHFGSFSFHEVKNITALGEGGILCTNLAFGKHLGKCRFLGLDLSKQIEHWLYDVVAIPGKDGLFAAGNHSATEIQALCLESQLGRVRKIIAERKKAATYLNRRLSAEPGIITPIFEKGETKSTYHLYLLQIDPEVVGSDVQALRKKLDARGLVQIPHFAPLYKFAVMRQLGYDTQKIQHSCPVAEEAFGRRFTHLPLYDFTPQQLEYMADSIVESVQELKAGK